MTHEAADNLLATAKRVLPLLKGLLAPHYPDLTSDPLWGAQAFRELRDAIRQAEQF